jgi:hypothetical protein
MLASISACGNLMVFGRTKERTNKAGKLKNPSGFRCSPLQKLTQHNSKVFKLYLIFPKKSVIG